MAFTKYAKFEGSQILDIKGSKNKAKKPTLQRIAEFDDYNTEFGYLYARIRAISSRTNANFDGWPSDQLAGGADVLRQHTSSTDPLIVEANKDHSYGYSTFLGRPVFVDHNNSDPRRARGVVVDSKLHVENFKAASKLDPYYASAPDYYLPPTWVELLLEIDAKTFPKLAKALIDGAKDPNKGMDGFSMGANVKWTKCSLPWCSKIAHDEDQMCDHVKFMKGSRHSGHNPKTGRRETWECYEICYEPNFFELSGVFSPADNTALTRELIASVREEGMQKHASARNWNFLLKKSVGPDPMNPERKCPSCGNGVLDPDHGMKCSTCGFVQHMAAGMHPDPNATGEERYIDQPCPACQGVGFRNGVECSQCQGNARIDPGFYAQPRGDITGLTGRNPEDYPKMPEPLQDVLYNIPHNDARMSSFMKGSPDPGDDAHFGGKPGAARKAFDAMIKEYGKEKGEEVYYATRNKHKGKTAEIMPGQYDVNNPKAAPGRNGQTRINGVCPGCGADGFLVSDANGVGCNACGWDQNNGTPNFDEFGDQLGQALHMGKTSSWNDKLTKNDLPQTDLLSVPQKVDTLRKGEVCEVCGTERDKDEKCPTCGFAPPPSSLDNPDLTKSREQAGENMAPDGTHIDGYKDPLQEARIPPPRQMAPNFQSSASIISDMKDWTFYHPKLGMGKINPIERPVLPNGPPATNEPVRETIVTQPSGPVTSRTAASMIAAVKQKENNMKTADFPLPEAATPEANVDVVDVGGVMDASNEEASKADAQVNLLDTGVTPAHDVEAGHDSMQDAAPDSDDSGFNADQTTTDSGPTMVWDLAYGEGSAVERQEGPVTTEPFPASEEGVKKSKLQRKAEKAEKKYKAALAALDAEPFPSDGGPDLAGGSANQGTQPADPVGNAMERVDVLSPATTPESNNSGPTITWTGTDGNSYSRQQEPVTNETLEGDDGVKKSSFTPHVINAMKLADMEIEMGVLAKDEKYNRLAALAETDPALLAAQIQTLAKVKTAGLRKAPSVVRTAGTTRLPAFNKIASEERAVVNTFDEALFM